jgi:hypothetical protein
MPNETPQYLHDANAVSRIQNTTLPAITPHSHVTRSEDRTNFRLLGNDKLWSIMPNPRREQPQKRNMYADRISKVASIGFSMRSM